MPIAYTALICLKYLCQMYQCLKNSILWPYLAQINALPPVHWAMQALLRIAIAAKPFVIYGAVNLELSS